VYVTTPDDAPGRSSSWKWLVAVDRNHRGIGDKPLHLGQHYNGINAPKAEPNILQAPWRT